MNHLKESLEGGISAWAAVSSLEIGLVSSMSQDKLRQGSSVESGPPAKSLQATQLSGFFLRSNDYPREGILTISHSFCSRDVHCPSYFLFKVTLLVYTLRHSQSYSRYFKITIMKIPIGHWDSI